MVTKGLDLPGVTLVGVLSADLGLDMPDFRATERTFGLLAQVAGRTGRGERGGEVVKDPYAWLPPNFKEAVKKRGRVDIGGFLRGKGFFESIKNLVGQCS